MKGGVSLAQSYSYSDHSLFYMRNLLCASGEYSCQAQINEGYTIFYNLSGRKRALIEGSHYDFFPRECVIARDLESYAIYHNDENPGELIALSFTPYIFSHFSPDLHLFDHFTNREIGTDNIVRFDNRQQQLFQAGLLHLKELENTCPDEIMRIAIFALVIQFLLEIKQSRTYRAPEKSFEARCVLDYINGHITDSLSLEKLAQYFFMSKSCFCKHFKQYTGTTFSHYVTLKRVIIARELMRKGMSAADASEKCGFKEYTTFYKAHQRFYHYQPRENQYFENSDLVLLSGLFHIERIP